MIGAFLSPAERAHGDAMWRALFPPNAAERNAAFERDRERREYLRDDMDERFDNPDPEEEL